VKHSSSEGEDEKSSLPAPNLKAGKGLASLDFRVTVLVEKCFVRARAGLERILRLSLLVATQETTVRDPYSAADTGRVTSNSGTEVGSSHGDSISSESCAFAGDGDGTKLNGAL